MDDLFQRVNAKASLQRVRDEPRCIGRYVMSAHPLPGSTYT
ncbi:MAG: hypothetical protein ACI9IV_000165, partial [Paracoccaceae bacterium]